MIKFVIFLMFLFTTFNHSQAQSSVLAYLINVEIQFEGDLQKENIISALNDILTLSEFELKEKKYKNYLGKENQWDVQTLILKHFVPDNKTKTLGENFYTEIKAKDVQLEIKRILNELNDI